jgi:hypothetical protein
MFQLQLGRTESVREQEYIILGTQAERNRIRVHSLQVIFISNHDSWPPLEDLQSSNSRAK